MVARLLQVRAHLVLCFRAEEKIEMVRGPDGKYEVRKRVTGTGVDGWVPVAEKTLPYELTASLLLLASRPGYPVPIKLQEQHRPFFPPDQPITRAAGRRLAEWAQGGAGRQVELPEGPPVSLGVGAGGDPVTGLPVLVLEERAALLTAITAAADRVSMSPQERRALALRHLGGAKPEVADVAALQDLLDAVQRHPGPHSGAE
jgi:hypothetical protein